jgi:dihydrofolate synthase/folylpolyglutamate synthase
VSSFTSKKEALAYLYSLQHFHPRGDLTFIKHLLKELGNPQDSLKLLHVTGTNGKGSTCYYLRALLEKAGQKTGLFVSPYVEQFNERIQIAGRNISDAGLIEAFTVVKDALKRIQKQDPAFSVTIFEFETAAAFWAFKKAGCTYAVIEVGIGGRHDSTNVIRPEVSCITTVGLDHEQLLGPHLSDIAREKSGIIKAKTPVVLGNIPRSVLKIFLTEADQKQSPVSLLGCDFSIKKEKSSLVYQAGDLHYEFKNRPLAEGYDIAVAVTAFKKLGLPVPKKAIEQAIDETKIPGRMQVVNKRPLVLADGAHNQQAMNNLLQVVRKKQKAQGSQVYVLLTMMKDKDLEQVLGLFKDEKITLTTLAYPRAAKLADFPARYQKLPYAPDFWQGYQSLAKKAGPHDIILVTGSFYLVGAFLNKWKEER